jgi:hypothetical protein
VPCVPGILLSRKPKNCQIYKRPIFEEKGWTIPHEKVPLFLDEYFLVNGMDNSTSNYHEERYGSHLLNGTKCVEFFLTKLPPLKAPRSVAVLRLCVVLTDGYGTVMVMFLISFDRYKPHLVPWEV